MSSNKSVVITGGAGDIGKAIGKQLASEGYDVVLVDVRENIITVAEELSEATGRRVLGFTMDVTDPESVKRSFLSVQRRLNVNNLFGLINNAGITIDSTFRKMTYEQWDSVIKVNLYGAFNCTKEVVEGMIQNKSGRIVNISSISRFGNYGQANYSASKSGLVGFTMTLAKELGKYGITVNAISPGIIDTNMSKTIPEPIKSEMLKRIPLGRMGKPQEIAYLLSFLISENANYINGEVINVSGGFYF